MPKELENDLTSISPIKLENDRRRIELMHSLLFTLPGSPILYYGDELGMGDNIMLFDRGGVRTPMQWESGHGHAGFTSSTSVSSLYLPMIDSPLYGAERVNVLNAKKDCFSLFNVIKKMIATRKKHSCFGWGTLRWIETALKEVLAFVRENCDDAVLVIHNLCDKSFENLEIELPSLQAPTFELTSAIGKDQGILYVPVDILETREKYPIKSKQLDEKTVFYTECSLMPFSFIWLKLSIQ